MSRAARRAGMALWLTAAALLAFFENNTGTRAVLIASLLIPAVSVLCAHWTAKRLTVSLTAPASCAQGQRADASITLTAPITRWGCCVRAEIVCANRMTGRVQAMSVETSGALPLDTGVFGALRLAVSRTVVSDWFGIAAFDGQKDCAAETTVRPELYPVRLCLSAPQTLSQQTGVSAHTGRSTEETMGARPYLPGDPIRMMHWKLTARLDAPFVRETAKTPEDRTLLLLDAFCASDAPDADRVACARAFLSAAQALCEAGIPFLACTAAESSGEPCLYDVTCRAENEDLLEAVLRTPLTAARESIGTRFAARYPELQAARVALFAPSPQTDAASICEGRRVTLVLPYREDVLSGVAEIAVQTLDESHAELEL